MQTCKIIKRQTVNLECMLQQTNDRFGHSVVGVLTGMIVSENARKECHLEVIVNRIDALRFGAVGC